MHEERSEVNRIYRRIELRNNDVYSFASIFAELCMIPQVWVDRDNDMSRSASCAEEPSQRSAIGVRRDEQRGGLRYGSTFSSQFTFV